MTMYVITHKHFYYQNLPNGYMPLLVGANKNANPDKAYLDVAGTAFKSFIKFLFILNCNYIFIKK